MEASGKKNVRTWNFNKYYFISGVFFSSKYRTLLQTHTLFLVEDSFKRKLMLKYSIDVYMRKYHGKSDVSFVPHRNVSVCLTCKNTFHKICLHCFIPWNTIYRHIHCVKYLLWFLFTTQFIVRFEQGIQRVKILLGLNIVPSSLCTIVLFDDRRDFMVVSFFFLSTQG